jgi:hypothetical protein
MHSLCMLHTLMLHQIVAVLTSISEHTKQCTVDADCAAEYCAVRVDGLSLCNSTAFSAGLQQGTCAQASAVPSPKLFACARVCS